MKRSLKQIALALLLLAAQAVAADPVLPSTAAKVARAFWRNTLHAASETALVDRTAEWPWQGIYLFVHPDGGWVMVAADDAARPVLAYSRSGRLVPDSLPVPMQQWLSGCQQQLDCLRANAVGPQQAYARDAAEWRRLLDGTAAKDSSTVRVGPLITTQWDQTSPYNLLCPTGTVVGCAATAQAQLMKYWNWPPFGEGSHSYRAGGYGMQQADFAHTLYDWSNMPNRYFLTQQQKLAVATLMYHCGVSLEMDYGTAAQGGSAALGLVGEEGYYSIDNSLKDFFCYSRDMYVVFKDNGYTNDEWRDVLTAELDLGHPVVYGGFSEQGGHGFVCDGYESTYLHFNFGWNGIGDGFYSVDSISPGVGGAGGNGTYTFNLGNSALIGAVPAYDMRVSDTLFNFDREGGADSLLFCRNDAVDAPWSVASDADWLHVDAADSLRVGWVRFQVDSLAATGERVAWLTFTQGSQQRHVRVVQANYDESEMCTLTVVMESRRDNGWQGGAYLSLESANGHVFGTASLESGSIDSVDIRVASHDVYAVWHSGGGTDRFINYWVRNQYGENCVEAVYAHQTGGTHLISWPCAHVGIVAPEAADHDVSLYPNPVRGLLHVRADGLRRVEVMDIGGRRVLTTERAAVDMSQLPVGQYFVRVVTDVGSAVQRVVKK